MWTAHILMLLGGLAVLAVGGEGLVRGASRLARALGVSSLAIGLTVVAFGTSAPEAAVTIYAASHDLAELAVGNVVGSNIANILLILGVAAILAPLAVPRSLIRVDGPIMILAAAAFMALAWVSGEISRWAGVTFVCALIIYTYRTYALARRTPLEPKRNDAPTGRARHWWYNLSLVIIGVAGLVGGAKMIVSGASAIATMLGISEHVIGLTIVAIGTSLPELATAAVAARHQEPEIAIGNVVGSNIFNILFVAGLGAITQPLVVPPEIIHFDGPLMVAICVLFYPLVYTGQRVTRWEGGILVALYAAYLTWTAIQAA